MYKYLLLSFVIFIKIDIVDAQGLANNYFLGYLNTCCDAYTTSSKARITFPLNIANLIPENRKMGFNDTQGNISDENGNLLMSSNGIWIANATGDTMENGSGLNPGTFTNDWLDGLPLSDGNLFLPYPGDTTKYILFHMTGNYSNNYRASELFYSMIDLSFNGGLGKVTLKNQIALQDTLSWGIAACKHANGRDWWIIVLKDNTDIIYKILLTPAGIQSATFQHVGLPNNVLANATQIVFSPDGKKFAYNSSYGPTPWHADTRLFDFDRCSGQISNYRNIDISDSFPTFGCAFSSNSKYLYAATTKHIYQINTDTTNVIASLDTVATYDGFYSPVQPFACSFLYLYLGGDGKIYGTSGNSVIDMHYINKPDSDGISCDVLQHAFNLPCWNFRTAPNHPNYYLGCDTASGCPCLITNVSEAQHDFHFSIFPNPITNQQLKIAYLLPQNQKGMLEMYDITGRKVFSYALPQFSTLQYLSLPNLSSGIYSCIISSGLVRTSKKVAVVKE